jgi:hypothetical protein
VRGWPHGTSGFVACLLLLASLALARPALPARLPLPFLRGCGCFAYPKRAVHGIVAKLHNKSKGRSFFATLYASRRERVARKKRFCTIFAIRQHEISVTPR